MQVNASKAGLLDPCCMSGKCGLAVPECTLFHWCAPYKDHLFVQTIFIVRNEDQKIILVPGKLACVAEDEDETGLELDELVPQQWDCLWTEEQ